VSATGRSDARRDADHYETPPWTVERFLEFYRLPEGASVLDPCAANGELLATLKRLRPDLKLYAIELRPECESALAALEAAGIIEGYAIGDFFALAKSIEDEFFDYVLTNPPYSLAREFITEGNRITRFGNIHLLRLNFLGAQKRRDWTWETRPGALIVPNRPSFTGWGGDATEYAWLIYKDLSVRGTWDILSLTPDDVIEAWNAAARARFPEMNPKVRRAAKDALEALAEAA